MTDPFLQFEQWFAVAMAASLPQPEAMTLSTVTREGKPAARVVLLKGVSEGGFVFFTNYESRKSQELLANPHASLVFFWSTLERQIRIEGLVAKTSPQESEVYFRSRPRDSQLGAWASKQSAVISGREVLEQHLAAETKKYEGREVLCPPHWGGFRLIPEVFEFWEGRSSRLHDRIRFTRVKDQSGSVWTQERLSP